MGFSVPGQGRGWGEEVLGDEGTGGGGWEVAGQRWWNVCIVIRDPIGWRRCFLHPREGARREDRGEGTEGLEMLKTRGQDARCFRGGLAAQATRQGDSSLGSATRHLVEEEPGCQNKLLNEHTPLSHGQPSRALRSSHRRSRKSEQQMEHVGDAARQQEPSELGRTKELLLRRRQRLARACA